MASSFAVVLSVWSAPFASSDEISSDTGRILSAWRKSLFDMPETIFLGLSNCGFMFLLSVLGCEFHFLKGLSCGFYFMVFTF